MDSNAKRASELVLLRAEYLTPHDNHDIPIQ
jgi:hypothetical protein